MFDTRTALRLDLPYQLRSDELDRAVTDYLDHHGELARLVDEVKDEALDDRAPATYAREILHRHLLAIVLLLERIEAHELAHVT